MEFDRKTAVSKYGDSAKALCAVMGTDPNTNMTHTDHVFECLTCVAPRWQHVAHRMHLDDLIAALV